MHISVAFPGLEKAGRLELHLLNNNGYMLDNANDTSLSGNCLAFLRREVRDQGEQQNKSPGASSASV